MEKQRILLLTVRNRDVPLRFSIGEEDSARLAAALLHSQAGALDFFRFSSGTNSLVLLNLAAVHAIRYASIPLTLGETEEHGWVEEPLAYFDTFTDPVALSGTSAESLYNLCWQPPSGSSRHQLDEEDGSAALVHVDELVCLVMSTESFELNHSSSFSSGPAISPSRRNLPTF